jgi:hypothetical protein
MSCHALQAGSPLPALPKGAAITLTANIDMQQANPMHYKATDETAKFEQVGLDVHQWCPMISGWQQHSLVGAVSPASFTELRGILFLLWHHAACMAQQHESAGSSQARGACVGACTVADLSCSPVTGPVQQ